MPHPLSGKYTLVSCNGKTVGNKSITLVLSAGEGGDSSYEANMHVANVMNAVLSFTNGKLKGRVVSTMMMGSKEEMLVEDIIGNGFDKGMDATRDGKTLTLSVGSDSLVYQAE